MNEIDELKGRINVATRLLREAERALGESEDDGPWVIVEFASLEHELVHKPFWSNCSEFRNDWRQDLRFAVVYSTYKSAERACKTNWPGTRRHIRILTLDEARAMVGNKTSGTGQYRPGPPISPADAPQEPAFRVSAQSHESDALAGGNLDNSSPRPIRDHGATASQQIGAATAGETAPSGDLDAEAKRLLSVWRVAHVDGRLAWDHLLPSSQVAWRAVAKEFLELRLVLERERASRIKLFAKLEAALATARGPWSEGTKIRLRGILYWAGSGEKERVIREFESAVRGTP